MQSSVCFVPTISPLASYFTILGYIRSFISEAKHLCLETAFFFPEEKKNAPLAAPPKNRVCLMSQGCDAKLRQDGDKPYVTDNDNYIVDLYFTEPIKDANQAGKEVRERPAFLAGGGTHTCARALYRF